MESYQTLKRSLMHTWRAEDGVPGQMARLQRAIVTVGLYGGRPIGTVGVVRAGEGMNSPPADQWPSWWPPRIPFRPVFL